jgi:hypothetical protein
MGVLDGLLDVPASVGFVHDAGHLSDIEPFN